MLRFMGSQRVRHDWATELNPLIDLKTFKKIFLPNGIHLVTKLTVMVNFFVNLSGPQSV